MKYALRKTNKLPERELEQDGVYHTERILPAQFYTIQFLNDTRGMLVLLKNLTAHARFPEPKYGSL